MRDFGPNRWRCSLLTFAAVGLAVLCTNGCGAKVEMKALPNTAAQISDSDKAKVKEYLAKAGKKGEPVGITDSGDHWLVELQPEPVAVPGRRVMIVGPESYKVDKATGRVTGDVGAGGSDAPASKP